MTAPRSTTLAAAIALCLAGMQAAEAKNCSKDPHPHKTLCLSTACSTEPPKDPILRFAQISDVHIYDDDGVAPFNGNALELGLEPTIGNGSAQRLQDEYTDEVLNAMVETINECKSGYGGKVKKIELMIATGDIIDTMTLNELRRYIDNLDGVASQPTAYEANCGYLPGITGPDCPLGLESLLKVPTGQLVADSQSNPPNETEFVVTRSPRQNVDTALSSAAQGSLSVAPGLPDTLRCDDSTICANHRLEIPHFAVFGNHDGAIRGTLTMQRPFQAVPTLFGRHYLQTQREWINEFFFTKTEPEGHGFNYVDSGRWDDPDDRNDGYYVFGVKENGTTVGPGDSSYSSAVVRMIVLNTLYDGVLRDLHGSGNDALGGKTMGLITGGEISNPAALESGVISPEQFDWLKGELADAANAGKPALVFSHHPDRSFFDRQYGFPIDVGSKTAQELDQLLGCARYDASQPSGCAANPKNISAPTSTLVAHIAGHTHENIIRACRPGLTGCPIETGESPQNADVQRAFWRVETASLIDYPQEGRIIELFQIGNDKGWGLRMTMIEPDPKDSIAALSYRLSVAEATCNISQLIGGPLKDFPTDQETLMKRAAAIQSGGEAAVQGKFCQEGSSATEILTAAGGGDDDRNVILLP